MCLSVHGAQLSSYVWGVYRRALNVCAGNGVSRKAHTARVELGQLCHSPLVAADMAEFNALLLCLAAQLLSEGRRGSAVFLPPSAVPHFAAPV